MQKARVHLYITGRVQGVFYRAFTREVAYQLRLKGWVKNLHDGRVEALFEGDREDIEKAIARCHAGPPGAKVDKVDVEWEEYRGDASDFEVRYY